MKYSVGSLFAGVGGICLGFKQAKTDKSNFELKWANEIDEHACVTYAHNFNHKLIQGDIEKIVKPERETDIKLREEYKIKQKEILNQHIDILTGGFPCQAFSIAGQRLGFDDHRGNLFWSIVDLIKLLDAKQGKPSVLFLENVKNLVSHDDGKTYEVIKNELQRLGYFITEHVLNTKDYTELPQNRERIYIVGFLDKDAFEAFDMFKHLDDFKLSFTQNERHKTIKRIINFNTSKDKNKEFYYTKEKYPKYFVSENEYNVLDENDKKSIRINLEEDINEEYEFYQVRRGMYVRKNQSGVCPTLTANMGTGGHNVPLIKVNDGIRKITPQEAFKLQGFPVGNGYELPSTYNGKKYANSYFYKQAGNAVSVEIIKLIATQILEALDKSQK